MFLYARFVAISTEAPSGIVRIANCEVNMTVQLTNPPAH